MKLFHQKLKLEEPLTKMIFFGSRAKGKPHRDSDIDLIIVSPTFRRQKSFQRGLNFYKHWNLDYPVDFLCYTPEEFNRKRKEVSLVRQAVREGIEIK